MKVVYCTLAFTVIIICSGCSQLAVWFAPERLADTTTDSTTEKVQLDFLSALENGRYPQLDAEIEQLTMAYLKHPNNPRTNLYLGMAHLWAVAERKRLDSVPARIIDHLALADFYLGEASKLNPDDARIVGFQASARMAMGSVHNDERWKRRGYFQAKDAISDYPEFNLFVMSNAIAQLPPHAPGLEEAESTLWRTAEVCFGSKVDVNTFNVNVMHEQVIAAHRNLGDTRRERACFNSVLAPHNVEGFFLHFGDVLLKTGKPKIAKAIYKLASAAPSYSTWPYKHVAEGRIAQLDSMAERFRRAKHVEEEPEIMARAAYACVACHQK